MTEQPQTPEEDPASGSDAEPPTLVEPAPTDAPSDEPAPIEPPPVAPPPPGVPIGEPPPPAPVDDPPPPPPPAAAQLAPPPTPSGGTGAEAAGTDRPELAVGAAFAGGFLAALILKRLAR